MIDTARFDDDLDRYNPYMEIDESSDSEQESDIPLTAIQKHLEDHYNEILEAAFDESDDDDGITSTKKSKNGKNFVNKNIKNLSSHGIIDNDAVKFSKGSNTEKASLQPAQKAFLHKYEHKINLDKISYSSGGNNNNIFVKDKADRATVENVLDPRTRGIIFKFLRNGLITSVNGCISTGKEANVYECSTSDPNVSYALKVYKTSILVFKDRTNYTLGEFRFRRGYRGKNPRKMVTAWAEKEVRNLSRMFATEKMPCPKPIIQKNNCLLMTFIGDSSTFTPAPRLKDTGPLPVKKWSQLYLQTMKYCRIIFQECHLVHADLSEYNMLYYNGDVVIIDVSQSVEHDHPNALVFLRKDCFNVNQFFKSKNVLTCTVREFTDFVTSLTLKDNEIDEYLNNLMEKVSNRGDLTIQEEVDDAVFKDSHIARRLDQVRMKDAEDDLIKASKGDTSEVLYATITGLGKDLQVEKKPEILNDESEDENSEQENEDEKKEEEEEWVHPKARPKVEIDKKAHKKLVKEENREKRKSKTPKHVKKRKEKQAKSKK